MWKKNKLKNLRKANKASVKSLVLAIDTLDSKKINALTRAIIRNQSCPNHLAVTLATYYEQNFSNRQDIQLSAELYHLGSRCAKKGSPDREQYLTRSGILHYYLGKYKIARNLLKRVRPTDFFSSRALYWHYQAEKKLHHMEKAHKILNKLLNNYTFSFHASVARTFYGEEVQKDAECLSLNGTNEDQHSPLTSDSLLETNASSKASKIYSWISLNIKNLDLYQYKDAKNVLLDWILNAKILPTYYKWDLMKEADLRSKIFIGPYLLMGKPCRYWTKEHIKMIFPDEYLSFIQTKDIDPFLMLSLAKKESLFDPKALSVSKAYGLLQIQFKTALRYNPQLTREEELFNPKINLEIGEKYLVDLMKYFHGNWIYTIASYNAGEDKIERWTERYPTDDPVLFIDLIPYRETRNYVGYVLNNYYWYQRLYNDNTMSLFDILKRKDEKRKTHASSSLSTSSYIDH